MAATRLIAMHVNKGRTALQCLHDRVEYVKNDNKTEKGEYISAYECNPEIADIEFNASREEYYHSIFRRILKSDVIAYQIRQSFKPGEISPEEANKVGYETAMRFTKGNHAFFVATHTDRAHIHNHILFNSTNLQSNKKFRDFYRSGIALQRLSDLICLEHGLSVIVPAPYGQRKKRTEFPKRPKIRDNIKADIDAILSQKPKDYDAFLQKLRDCGYEVKLGKHVAVKGKSQQRFIRLKSLGADYTAESIKRKILGTDDAISNDNKQTRDMNLLIDIDAKMREGKNGGYITWAKRHNNKQFAQTIMFLQDHKVSDFDEICKRADESAEVFHEISNKIKAVDSEIKKLANIRSAIINYSKTRDVYVVYRKSGYSPKYLEKHREEIMLHRAAKDVFSNMDGKIPKVKDQNAKIKELAAEKGKLYSEYHSYKKEMKDWQIAKQNIEEYLGFNNEHEKEKSKSKDHMEL